MKKANWTSIFSFLSLIWIIIFFMHGATSFLNEGTQGIVFITMGPTAIIATIISFLRDGKRAKAEREQAQVTEQKKKDTL